MGENIISKYECPACENQYTSLDSAYECCPPEEVFVCVHCQESFPYRSEAEEHIESDHPEEIEVNEFGLPIVSQYELEAAGQERLFR